MSFLRFMLVSLILLSTTLWAGVGKVALLKGEATLERGVQKLALQNGTALEEKDIIKTSKDAQVQLMFEDKTVITLGSESEFKIEEYLNDTANPKAKFKFNQGAFKTITGQIGKTAPENFKLETKTATIGIRGTIVAGNVPPPPPPAMPPMPEAIFCLGGTITVAPITMPTIIVIVPTGSFTQMLTPSTPPSPPVIFTPADLQQLNQNLGGTPPPPPPGGTPPQSGNTPPTANPDGGNDSPPPAPSRAPAPAPSQAPVPQTFTPTAAASALQTNSQTLSQNLVIQNVAQELNVSSDTIQDQIQNQICPSGTTGTFPNCVAMTCPENTTGVYPNCTALTCPAGTTGTYPNCVAQTCPSGTTGTFPNCVALTCPSGTTGTYPNCTALTCPEGTTGTYPNCNLPQPTTKTVYMMAASDTIVINNVAKYFYEPGKNITLSSDNTNPHPTLQNYNAIDGTASSTGIWNSPFYYEKPFDISFTSYPDYQEIVIYGEKTTVSLPTSGISTYTEPSELGGNNLQVNFANKKALLIDLNDGVSILMGEVPTSGTTLSGTVHDYGLEFTEKSEGTFVGQFFGSLNGSYGPVGVGLVGVAEDFNKSGSVFSSVGYSAGAFGGDLNISKSSITDNTTGVMQRTGLVTSRYDGNNTSINNSISLDINKSTGSSTGSITLSDARGSYALTQADANKSVYISDKYFAIVGFNGQESWLVGIPTGLEYVDGSRVSWGMWAVDETSPSKMYNSSNYWVAGENTSTAADHIGSLQLGTSYTYNGKVLGRVYDGVNYYRIDPYNDTSNAVQLKFNFGSGSPIDSSQSYIKFTVDTNKLWDINISGSASSGMFSGMLGGTRGGAAILGDINGSFYGNAAESIGGTFKATVPSYDNGNYAMGVFVGAHTATSNSSTPLNFMIQGSATSLCSDGFSYENLFTLFLDSETHAFGHIVAFETIDFNTTNTNNFSVGSDAKSFTIGNIMDSNITEISGSSTYPNAWLGTWSSLSDNNATLITTDLNYWAAGPILTNEAVSKLLGAMHSAYLTPYIYEGSIIGSVFINDLGDGPITHGFVKLQFNFGDTHAPLDSAESYINFYTNNITKLWDINLTGGITTFPAYSATLGGSVNDANITTYTLSAGNLVGNLYADGNSSGGTFKAIYVDNGDTYTAVGAFVTELTSATPTCPTGSTGTYPNCIPFQLTGFATSMYDPLQDGNISISIADTLLIGATQSALSGGITLDINSSVYVDIAESATVTTINDFNTTKIWTVNTVPNDYVSWGYWTSPQVDGNKTLIAGTNYWVAGKDAAAAAAYIGALPTNTHYIFSGKALGKVNGIYDIDPVNDATNSVQLKFNFGGGINSIYSDSSYSWIKFTANNQLWTLTPTLTTPNVTAGKFSDTLTGTAASTAVTGAINGQFFGNQAQAVGGTFKASSTDATLKALGVFKAVR